MSQRISPMLAWGMAATLLASAWALWWPQETKLAQATSTPRTAASPTPASPSSPASTANAAVAPAPMGAANPDDRPTLSPPSRDPFNATPPPAPPAAVNKAEAEQARSPPPPPPPAPPRMDHRVVGRFKSPEGQQLVFLQDGAQTVVAAAGLALSSGYVVESITPREIRLRHPLAEQAVSLPLPEDNAP